MKHPLQQHLLQTGMSNRRAGIYSVCSAHPWVLQAAAQQSKHDNSLLLIEATSNQVNQYGGYTGMKPADFRRFAEQIVDAAGFDRRHLILGGDHLGPNPWRSMSADEAMTKAVKMVEEYAGAGFSKIHLDASMPCGGEASTLNDETVAARAARLCAAAEEAVAKAGLPGPVYVIGTEVPTPGGATHELGELAMTSSEAAQKTLEIHHQEFEKVGLHAAWERVLALVVQPGVEFDHDSVVDYSPCKAIALSAWLRETAKTFVFEAHSTDYQKPEAYAQLVQDGFSILKVGPALTFAMREALFALADMEQELLPADASSRLRDVVEQTMLQDPAAWKPYYEGTPVQQKYLRVYSYSDRMRYYWANPRIESAITQLTTNMRRLTFPETMLSAYLPRQYERVREGTLNNDTVSLIVDRVRDVLRIYSAAC